ncbi:glycosyl transferase [Bowdeniella nasicola]|uniref:Glycosyl transferase n=1 Tax=Bowdeniella nasicola TaxID=208480 RepID=A0A1Q5Q555_9ACTO|nr:glycosyltransferase [Bowdeniella nasicola]OKL54954.1 glycosyl transferase [Bowdeniella nasicola]
MANLPQFSVLMAVYRGDNAVFLTRALQSVSVDQELKPDQIVIVRDGPVPTEISRVLARAEEITGGIRVDVVPLPDNVGLARALREGLKHCEHDVIARADADDICLPNRFAVQIPLMTDLDLLGAGIAEFQADESETGLVRRLPMTAEDIRDVLPLRDPFNHPSVVFRAAAVNAAGGYDDLTKMEDYWLFARMVHAGARVANVPDILVRYRVGAGAYSRRGGLDMVRAEVQLQRAMLEAGITSPMQFVRNIAVRGGYRLIPAGIKKVLYRTAMSTGWKR